MCIKNVPNKKKGKKNIFLKSFGLKMVKNIKIHNVFYLIKVSNRIQTR